MTINPNIALIPMQGVKDQGNAVDSLFDTFYQSAQNKRRNTLMDIQDQANQRAGEIHQANMDTVNLKNQGLQKQLKHEDMAMLYKNAVNLKQLGPEQRAMTLGELKPSLLRLGMTEAQINDGLDDNELDYVINRLKQYAPVASDAATQSFEARAKAAGLEPGSAEYSQAAKIDLGLAPRAATSAQERIASNQELTKQVAESEATIAGAKAGSSEEAKLKQKLEYMPQIQSAVKTAESKATSEGETLSELNRTKAAMPGLMQAVADLRELAPLATSTLGGKIWDSAVKETGFGATEGATARAKFVAIIDNQMLPLLKETFGAAFTAQEGESLKATLGDPDATPDEKMAQLDAFIDQKMRNIETKERQLGQEPQQETSIEDLVNKYAN